jgi:pyrimidine operon attenuation protein / uracil phosphoribosyltransferase
MTIGVRQLLDPATIGRGLMRVAGEILERQGGAQELVLIGVRRGGVPVAEALRGCIRHLEGSEVPLGTVDITLYRDDAASAMPNPRIGPSEIPVQLDGWRVVLVDDVIHTGRTVRAAIDALMDYGRPRCIQMAAVIDRGGRELPVQPDYLVRAVAVSPQERVDVVLLRDGLTAIVQPFGAPSLIPGGLP